MCNLRASPRLSRADETEPEEIAEVSDWTDPLVSLVGQPPFHCIHCVITFFHGIVYTYVEIAVHDITKITEAVGIDKERRYEMNLAECRVRDKLSLPPLRWTSLAKSAGFARKR